MRDLGLLLERLEPGIRVRADGDVIYVNSDLRILEGTEGTVVRPWGVGASYVRWDVALKDVVLTSNDSIALVERTHPPREPESGNVFHAHLDCCERCRNHPFDLCAVGAAALRDAALGGR